MNIAREAQRNRVLWLARNLEITHEAQSKIRTRWLYCVAGVYSITCLKTGMIYIGSSANIFVRLDGQLRELLRGYHKNKEMQEDFNKHGQQSFRFRIEYVEDDDYKRFSKEYLMINDYYNSGRGYNQAVDFNQRLKEFLQQQKKGTTNEQQ